MSSLKTKLNISSAYHPETDGATERVHRTIESILRGYVYNQHDTWVHFLPLAEFSYNNCRHSSTGFSPFEATYGTSPRTPAEFLAPPNLKTNEPDLLARIHDIHTLIQENLKIAKATQKYYADRNKVPIEYEVGNWVLLSTKNLVLPNQPSKKFKQRFVGPYKIIEKISSQAYRLELPTSMKIHNVFHIGLLQRYDHSGPNEPSSDNLPAIRAPIEEEDNLDYIKAILMHDIQYAPELYQNGEALVSQVEWEKERDISWLPFSQVFRTDEYLEYSRSKDYQAFLQSDSYKKLWAQYPHRGPKPPQSASSIGPEGM